jgi:hypothetical protein
MGWFLVSSTSWGLFGGLGFVVWVWFGLHIGCAGRNKQLPAFSKEKSSSPERLT